ncbi:MAG: hypothetical protein EAX96_12770 [Candidatus Lokiarchaeota archaeon]|nr:hypothetical protein [Candidatus Lokiarchaeota archaeon]
MVDENWWEEFGEEWKENLENFKDQMQDFMENMNELKFFKGFYCGPPRIHRYHRGPHASFHVWKHWMPFVKDEDDKYVIRIPLRKYTKDQIKLKVSNKRLVIVFQKEDKKPKSRYLPIPDDVDPEKTTAKVENGELIVYLFKKKPDISINIE